MDKQILQGEQDISMAQAKAEEVEAGWKDRASQFPHDKKLKKEAGKIIKDMDKADSTLCDAKLLFKKGLKEDKLGDAEYEKLKG